MVPKTLKRYGLPLLLVASTTFAIDWTSFGFEGKERSISTLNQNKVLDIDFDSNEIKNYVNNKTYSSANQKGTLVNSIKGKGFESNGDYIKIPASDLSISENEEYVTVSVQYKYGGTDSTQMLFAFGLYDLYMEGGWLGFNTGNGDIYGTPFSPSSNDYISIIAVFHKTDITKNKLYLNGVKQSLSFRNSNPSYIPTNPFNNDFYLFNWGKFYEDTGYSADGSNIMDEIKIFKGAVTDEQAKKLTLTHRIPQLYLQRDGDAVQLNWATEILESDIIYNYDFEDGEFVPNFNWRPNIEGDKTGGQKVTDETAYSGNRSLYLPKTMGGLGNWYGFPQTSSNSNIMELGRLYIPNGTPLSVSFRIKNMGSGNFVKIFGDGGWADKVLTYDITILEDSPAGSQTLIVDSINGIKIGSWITSDRSNTYGAEYPPQIVDIQHNSNGTYTLTMDKNFVYEQKAGEKLHYRIWRDGWVFNSIDFSESDWQLYNMNTSVTDFDDYDVGTRGALLYLATCNNSLAYLDSLRFGYATKVKLYRDHQLIYEGYDSQLTDHDAIDREAPVMNHPTLSSAYLNGKQVITFNSLSATERGTTYQYQIQSIGKSGTETFLSEAKAITITSGLAGYSYVIDTHPNTLPDDTLDLNASTTQFSYSIDSKDQNTYYLHIKPIDLQGNVGETLHLSINRPILTAEAKPSENMIRLDWTKVNESTYQVYQKKEGSDEFQTISMTDLTQTKQVKVLNIYPTSGNVWTPISLDTSYTTWDGEVVPPLPLSAQLKRWMEEPNNEHPKGYGMGLIEVTPVSFQEFDANALSYLKNADGTWKFDVIYYGHWDGLHTQLRNETTALLASFIKDGKGFLAGHDTLGYNFGTEEGLNRIRELFNVKVGFWDSHRFDGKLADEGHHLSLGVSGEELAIKRKGLLTNFPWNIGEVGSSLRVPVTHTTSNFFYGDIWMDFQNGTGIGEYAWNTPITTSINHYLGTWNNTALIQTGHSQGLATPDEQKVLANTLFYLNQLSSENYLNDYSGQDVKAPEIPSIKQTKALSNGSIELTFNPFVDQGSTYEYYVSATPKDKNSTFTSNIVSETITSGVAGVSYVIDTNPDTNPDNQIDALSNNKLIIIPNQIIPTYLHIKVIDQAGNVSETTHIEFKDSNPPQLDLYLESEAWTDQLVTIFANAWDNEFESGIEKIKLPNGNFVMVQDNSYAINTSYLANNGTHEFTAYDKAGNSTTKSITVNNVDLNAPNLDVFSANENWTSEDVTLDISAWDHDRESGIEKIKLPNGNFVFEDQGVNRLTTEYVVQENGIYEFIAYDRAGNVTKKLHPVYWIDRVEPEIELALNSDEYTNDSLTIQASTWDPTDTQKRSAGIQSLKLPDGTIVEVNDGEFTIDVAYPIHDNGVYTFVAYDKLGNTSTKSIQVTTIDKTNPNLSVYPKNTNAATSVEIQIDAWDNDFGSGIDRIQLPSGNFISVQEGQYNLNVSYPVFENGNYTFTAYDKVGNKTSQTLNINHLDNEPPLLSITGNPSTWTNQNVLLTVKGNDLDSGVSHLILPDGTIVSSDTTTYTVNTNGSYTFTVVDRAGNQSSETVHVSKIDKQIQPVTDITHSISLIDKLPYQREIEFTFPAVLDLESGLKGYSYLIDNKPNSIPDDLVDSTTTSIKYVLTNNETYYLHIKAIDNAGNSSIVTHHPVLSIHLTTTPNPTQNFIRLDWTNINESTYQVYQKKEGSNEFQTISMTDLSKSQQVQVLNVYPVYDGLTQQLIPLDPAFTTWDGEYINGLPQSARLKQWMEAPNIEHPKGYGQGFIKVTPVSLSEFNAYTEKYIKNSDGTWKYDVIMFGSWDGNGRSEDLTDQSKLIVEEFIQDGRGVLFGHDTIMHIIKNFSDLKTYTNMKTSVEDGIEAYFNYNYAISSNNALKLKPGLLTNFPWLIEKDSLDIPISHTNLQFYCGDTWYEFNASKPEIDSSISESFGHQAVEFNGCRNNSYLSTWNNTAMIQTGHSNGQATPDEQKIIANTLFYLNQLSDVNYLNDYSGQDVKGPETPSVKQTKVLSNGSLELTFNTFVDQGSTYEYYVTATPKDGNSTFASNVVSETITSGVAGVSYVIDTNPETEPDNQIDALSNNKLTVTPNSDRTTYLHLKVIDRAGNASETLHYLISIPKINTAEQREDQIYVNWDIDIPQSSVFWVEDFSSKYLDLPAGNLVTGIAFNVNGHLTDHWGVERPLNDPVRNGVKIIDGVGLNGSRGVIVNQTAPGNGWAYSVYPGSDLPVTSTDWSGTRFSDWQKLKTDRPAIARFSTKGEGEFRINLAADWTGNGVINQYGYTWAENLTATEFKTRLENLQPIKINNPSGAQMGGFHLTTAFDDSYSYNFNLSIGNIIINNGQWYYQPTAWFGPWSDSVKPGQTVTPAANRTVEPISIGKALTQLQGTPDADNSIKISTNNWTNYSMNLYLPTSKEIADLGDYFRLMTFFKSYSQMYIDEIEIAYAPKSRLYRNGKLIYEDYSVEHADGDVQDTVAPEKVIVSADYVNGKLQLTWTEASDRGTVYTYEVSGVDENGMESLRSEPKTVEFTSGVKEYRIYLNGTLIGTTPDLSYQFDQTIASSDRIEVGVVDQAGNESKTQLNLLNLTAQAKPSDNMIRLDWTNVNESTYQVYQKKEGSDEFQTISMTDLTKNKQVKVLNIYPTTCWELSDVCLWNGTILMDSTFTTWDGETFTLPLSARLKRWMEEPNAEHPKGYGKGVIEVTPVAVEVFNNNPTSYLKNSDGTWKYDVIMFGSWDSNGKDDDISNAARILLIDFIESNRGILFGHDTLRGEVDAGQLSPNLASLASYVNLRLNKINYDEAVWHRSEFVEVSKKGLLTNYPWNIGEIGTVLTIPESHTVDQVPNGDIWLKFNKTSAPDQLNYYLTTWNNAAMIQTGHSNGQATPDEQKILANTIFYLNQLSEANYLNDNSGQDVKGPETPSIKSTQSTPDGFVELTFNPFVDQGSTYEYYVKASPKNGSSNTISPIVSETITTGVAGVSYVVDTNPKTEPDNQLDVLTNNKLKVKLSETQTSYVHLKVIDQAGNSSETLHIPISTPPVLRSEVIDNTYVRLDWATEILPENMIYQTGFEPGDDINGTAYTGGMSISNQDCYQGTACLLMANGKTNGNNGHADGSLSNRYDFNPVYGLEVGMKFSASLWIKNVGEPDAWSLGMAARGGLPAHSQPFHLKYGLSTPIIVAEDTDKTPGRIEIQNFDTLYNSLRNNFLYRISTHVSSNYEGKPLAIWKHNLDSQTRSIIIGGANYKKGDVLHHIDIVYPLSLAGPNTPNNGEWTLYNFNGVITDADYDTALRGLIPYLNTNTQGGMYIDDIRFGYATKVKLYRDDQVIYEGYDAFLNDLEATDKAAPEGIDLKIANLTATPSQTNSGVYTFNFDFKLPTDQGSTYQYQIASVNVYGMESLKSNPASETVTSGIKGYSYLIDTHPTTDPDTIIDLAADQRQISYTGSGTHYLHIKVIDEAGNASETQHVKLSGLELTAEAKPSDNLIRLDWTDLNESTYQVYQKKEGATEFQSISMTDLSKSQQVQVLNIYPDQCWTYIYGCPSDGFIPLDSKFTTWDGETLTLPQSARLKRWMEEPNSEHPKGYGQGLIEVTPVSFTDFNQNPSLYLKNPDGTWKYNVIMIGTWDTNGNNNDITKEGRDLLIEFLEAKRGVLFGHDTIRGRDNGVELSPYLNSLHPYVNLRIGDIDYSEVTWHRSSQVFINRKGLLTNYPWTIGDLGTILTIPQSHTVDQLPDGDVWLKFYGKDSYDNYNYYLTTWNNAAMIQTGHSNGEATPDEQKILANTLFYLNQLSAENYLEDHSGQDIKAPVKPSVNQTEILPNGFIELQFDELIDQGSTYEYYVKATHKSGYEQVSNTVKETITTGVAGVSYVIDTHPDTEPDHQVDAFDNNTLQIKPNPSQTTYLHIKVIDQAGNSSETLHYVLDLMTLTAQAKPTENEGKGLVRLDWTEKPDHTYQVYQKKEGSDEFQSIGTTNFNTTKQVRVLNVYPLINVYDEPYTTWDGEFVPSQHKSAVLKEWMEKPNAEDPKGYGKGLIKVHPVTFDQFNQDPMSYLKNADGEWAYDVVMFGSTDSNKNQDLNQKSYLATKEFLDSGRGVLFGHDTVTQWQDMNYLPMLSNYVNVTTYPFIGDTKNTKNPAENWIMPWSGGTQVELVREGLFNTYPWEIGDVGNVLTIPYTHTNSQVAKGDVWLKFTNPHSDSITNVPIDSNEYSDNGVGTNMAYLTTWNNAAMIQTGHAINRLNATPDEQKIMANTLFYLNQLSSENWLDDHSGQDVKAPEMPSIKNHTYRADSLIELSFDTVTDNGSLYEYYVKATHKNGSGVALSNIASATVTTGVKGYSWVADSNPDTIPDEIIEQTNNQNIQIPTNNQGPYYFHIKAIDKAGNVSETFHYELTDTTKPTFTLTPNPTDWTNQDVIIMVDAYDSGTIPSGIKEIILPDGNKVSGDTATFTVIENGTYTFEVVDFMGNRQTESITISNIDKIKPTGSIIIAQDQDEFYEEETELHLNMSDILDGQEKLSGITTVEIFDVNGTYSYIINNPTDYQPTIPWVLVPYEMPDGSLKAQVGMTLTDKAGNTTTVYSKEVTIIKVRIDEFHLTDVINPRIYNSQNPFQRLSYPYIPSQELLVGGSFEFEAIYIYPPTTTSSWKATYEANIHYIHPTDGTKTIPLLLEKQSVDGRFSARHAIPLDAKIGTEVYLELRVAVYNSNGKLMGEDTFPDPAGTLLKIGEITGDIRELIQFNEIY